MSPKTLTILSPQTRRETIRKNILTNTEEEIAILCHCTTRTIKRDIQKWKQEGGFEEFLIDEFFRSYPDIKEKFPDKAFDRLCYLIGRTLTRKMEVKEEIKIEEKHIAILADYTGAIESASERDIQALRARKQVDTTPTNTKTS